MSVTSAAPPRLRPGQAEALKRFAQALRAGSTSELVVVPVGYGKTVIGVGSFEVAAGAAQADTCLYLTPTDVLRTQVYNGVERALSVIGSSRPIRKIMADNAALERVGASGANFIVASYQQVAAAPERYRRLCAGRRVHLVCDEAHHLGERGTWARALSNLPVQSILMLSATPLRLDRDAIAGARYVDDLEAGGAVIDPLLQVTMRQAWKEGRILKRLNMQMKDYAVELQSTDGEIYEFTASEMAELPDFDQRCVREQLRWNEDYVQPLVREFALTLQAKNAVAPGKHQGLVFAATTEHANHLMRVFGKWHPSLRCAVVHSGEGFSDAENERRMREFHEGRVDVLIQVKKASEGFDAPAVSVLLKLDAVFSREPVIQQLGRGLRFNHALPVSQNVLNVLIGRDPRLGSIIEHLERESPPVALKPNGDALAIELADQPEEAELDEDDEPQARPEILDVVEAGDAFLDESGRFVDGQQLTMFGVSAPAARSDAALTGQPAVEVVDIHAELAEAIEYCRTWTNRAARERSRRAAQGENQHAALNLAYSRESGKKGSLSTAAEYRAKGDWMKRKYLEFLR
ncbi:MAG: DEAD/DEAH box helicase family protein [Dehalococcoidia bacterium]